MKVHETGVLHNSNLYFHTPSEQARKLFFFPVCCGHYYCDASYDVKRSNYNSYLLLYVIKGGGYVYENERRQPVSQGSCFLLDCSITHRYGTETGWEIIWIHFDGQMAPPYYDAIAQAANSCVLTPPDPQNIYRNLQKIYDMFHDKGAVAEPNVNKYIVSLLTNFLSRSANTDNKTASIAEEMLVYITENIHKSLSVDELAKHAALSPFYFIRLFKKETGYTPHEYIINARVNAAKFYLKTTVFPIKEITYLCGFSSECSFCTTFKRIVGTTPATYRNSPSN